MASVSNPGALALLSVAIVAAACSNNPVAPDLPQAPLPSASSPSPQPAGPTSASLAVEDLSVIVKRSPVDSRGVSVVDGWFSLEVRFALRETGSKSGATVQSFFLGDGAGGGAMFDGFCVGDLRVPPGGVYDTLNTDEGYESWGYCAPYLGVVGAPLKESPVFLTVTFVDDDGRRGSVRAKAIWKY
jgi:hypothetical protein